MKAFIYSLKTENFANKDKLLYVEIILQPQNIQGYVMSNLGHSIEGFEQVSV